jgi:hypothetical protein
MRSPRQVTDYSTGYALGLQLRGPATVAQFIGLTRKDPGLDDLGHLAALAFTLTAFTIHLLHDSMSQVSELRLPANRLQSMRLNSDSLRL